MPIGTGAQYVAINMAANPSNGAWTPMPQVDPDIIVFKPTAPRTAINYSDAAWTGRNRCCPTGGLLAHVPMPSTFVVPNNMNNHGAAFLMPDNRTLIQTQPLTRCIAGEPATGVIKFAPVDIYGDGRLGGHGGSSLSTVGGTIRIGELRPGIPIRHAIKINVDSPAVLAKCATANDCFRWPAFTADARASGSYGTRNPNPVPGMKMGALLAIPTSTNINDLGLESVPGQMLAWTLQNYGAYIVDSTGGPGFAISAETGPDGSKRDQFKGDFGMDLEQRVRSNTPWSRDMQRLIPALYLVDNNGPTSIGGGGTPLQPLALPLEPPGAADTIPPAVPGAPLAAVDSLQINLSWAAATDNVGVVGYDVYVDDVALTSTTATSFQHTGLTAGTTYTFRVSAYDAAGNNSALTTPVSATTPAPDTGGGGGGAGRCFIATAAYGSPMARDVRYLRAFRDQYLLTNKPGRWFVEQYYRLSPRLADALRAHDGWRAIVRFALAPLVALSKWLVRDETFEKQTVDRP
jgi:fibronectin type III domain protein